MADLRPSPHLRACQEETVTAGSCPSPGLSRALAVGVIGCGWAAIPINALSIGLSPAPGSNCEVWVGFVPIPGAPSV